MQPTQEPSQYNHQWLEKMDRNMQTLIKQNDDLYKQNARLVMIIEGMPTGTPDQKKGVLGMVVDHASRIGDLEKFKFAAKWFFIGLIGPAGYGIFQFAREFILKH